MSVHLSMPQISAGYKFHKIHIHKATKFNCDLKLKWSHWAGFQVPYEDVMFIKQTKTNAEFMAYFFV